MATIKKKCPECGAPMREVGLEPVSRTAFKVIWMCSKCGRREVV